MMTRFFALALLLALLPRAFAQVHYHDDGRPWSQSTDKGPDAEVDGWYYNLGITGLRVILMPDRPHDLLIKHVFAKTPASRKLRVGDIITGVGGHHFDVAHQNGYGMEVFGAVGPISTFADALARAQAKKGTGQLALTIERGGKKKSVKLSVGTKFGDFAQTWPMNCKKSDKLLQLMCKELVRTQRADGSWGGLPQNLFAPLTLLAVDRKKYAKQVHAAARFHGRTTESFDESSLANWRYTAAGIFLSEYYLATKKKSALKELREVYRTLISTQYMSLEQLSPKVRESHPHAEPKTPEEAVGGWGHNPGFEGYGPICMITAHGALAFTLMKRCGIAVNQKRLDASLAFLTRATGKNGYVWYEDSVADHDKWADMGRTGAALIARLLEFGPDDDLVKSHQTIIREHPESFPDTHGSPLMGMALTALGARSDDATFRRLLDRNAWWFTLAQNPNGSFHYQPNRDNAGYGEHAWLTATASVAFILSLRERSLVISGKDEYRPAETR